MEKFNYRVDLEGKREDIRLFLLTCPVLTDQYKERDDGTMEADTFTRPSGSKIFISEEKNVFIYDKEIAINNGHAMFTVNSTFEDLPILEDILKQHNLNFQFQKVRVL